MQRQGRQSNGRRNYTRNSNAFKFHNFVFNEDNQSFCLEEQHGNKKITVLHWKKSDERLLSGEEETQSETAPQDHSRSTGKSISRQLSKSSSDGTSANKRRTHEVITSASFPPPAGHPGPSGSNALPSGSDHSSHLLLPPSSPSLYSSHTSQSPSTRLCPPYLAAGSVASGPHSDPRTHPLIQSTASSSSIATSSSSSSSQVANWLNQSLNDLDLTELPYRPGFGSRRKDAQVKQIVVDVESDLDKSDCEQESDSEMPSDSERDNVFQKYRRYLEQFDRDFEQVQTQPLDLSLKATRDRNNNKTHEWNFDSLLESKPFGKFSKLEDDESESLRSFASSNSVFSRLKREDRSEYDWRPLQPRARSVRSEVFSPSELISSVSCCSPLSDPNSTPLATRSSSAANPFLFTSPPLSHAPLSSSARAHHSPFDESLSTLPSTSKHRSYMFDTLLEEEISRMLQGSSKSSTLKSSKSEYNDIEERIEDKLRSLHREVLSRKETLEGNLERPTQDHLKMHFKLDSNRNLEPFGSEGKRTLSEPSLQATSMSSLAMSSKGRPSQRNQIKRQLEDAFKQNGFLVKVRPE